MLFYKQECPLINKLIRVFLRDQIQKLLSYCNINNLNVLLIFREDHSSKTFNRPKSKKLILYVKTNKLKIDQLLFAERDHFSRNTTES